jgi:hypothetical protein
VDPEADNIGFGEFVMREFAGDTPAAHHIGAITDMDDLDLFGADHKNGGAVVNQAVE